MVGATPPRTTAEAMTPERDGGRGAGGRCGQDGGSFVVRRHLPRGAIGGRTRKKIQEGSTTGGGAAGVSRAHAATRETRSDRPGCSKRADRPRRARALAARAPIFPDSAPVLDAPATADFALSSADLSWSLLRTARTREAAEPRRGLTFLAWTRTTAGAMAVRAPSDSMVTYHALSRWIVPRHRHASANLSREVYP